MAIQPDSLWVKLRYSATGVALWQNKPLFTLNSHLAWLMLCPIIYPFPLGRCWVAKRTFHLPIKQPKQEDDVRQFPALLQGI